MAQRSEPAGQTFLFADLSGFTALTEAHGDEQAADLVGGFCVAVRQLLDAHQAQEVKTIGDALMLRTGDAAAAIRRGCASCTTWAPSTASAGSGGHAHRLGGGARRGLVRDNGQPGGAGVRGCLRGEALLTAATRAAAGEVEGVEVRERGRRAFRNVGEPVPVFVAVRQGAHNSSGLPIDPVCRMAVDPWHGAGRLTHQGVEYCFCSLGCAGAFAQHPSRYTTDDR